MNVVLSTPERSLISLAPQEIQLIVQALRGEPNGGIGSNSAVAADLLEGLIERLVLGARDPKAKYEVADAWSDGCSVMVRCVTVFGDPVEMSESEAADFASKIEQALAEAR